jgi:Protein of unknown function (DUF3592)
VGLVSIALGISCAVIAWRGRGEWPGLEETLRSWGHPRAEGTVVSNDVRPFGTKTMTYPVVRYEVGGQPFQIVGNGRSPAQFEVDEKVTVSYDPRVPGRGRIVGFQQQYLPPLAILGAGIVLLGLGALALTTAFERRPAG